MFIVAPTAIAPFLVLLYDHFGADHVLRDIVRQLRRAGGATELTARIPGQVCRLVDHRILVSVPVGANRLGNPSHLLFESTVAMVAPHGERCRRRSVPYRRTTAFGKPKPGKVRVPSETLMARYNRNNFLLAQMRRATRISRNER